MTTTNVLPPWRHISTMQIPDNYFTIYITALRGLTTEKKTSPNVIKPNVFVL